MTSERWKQVETAFEQALDLGAEERSAFLEQACKGDDELRREVESLLNAHAQAGTFIDDRSQFHQELDSGESAAPQLIGHYRIVRELGRGGMGAVYLAERTDEYKKRVAIKLIKRGMDTDSVLRHFRNERQILAGFDHPNIGRLFDGGTTEDGLPYFVMEYIEGLPIDEYCNQHALSLPERLKLFREVCAAVSYAHRHLVIHRDIKRSNILVTTDGVPKLLDFGIAKILQTGEDAPTFATMTGQRLMTPEYASPEQVRGEAVTTATDVYSLGVVLYELLTGQFPYRFPSQTPRDIEHAITTTTPEKPSTTIAKSENPKFEIRNPKILRGDLDNIVLMALRKEPERRYQSAEQFSDDIRRHLEGRPVTARKDTAGYRAGKFIGRNKIALTAAALIFLSLVGGIIATTLQAYRTRQQKALAERRFNDVRKLAHAVLFDYHDAIKDLPGATKVRERLVEDALVYLDNLAKDARGDPALQRELAAAYQKVGDVRGGEANANLGDISGAIDSYAKSLRIREAILALNPKDAQARRDLAASHGKIGYRLLATDKGDEGMDHLRKAKALYFDLTQEQPANQDFQVEYADACGRLGIAMSNRGDFAPALEQVRTSHAVYEKLSATDARNPNYRRWLWTAEENIGYVLWQQGDIDGAIEANNKGRALGEPLVAEDPKNADYRRRLVLNYQRAGDLRKERDRNSAMEYFRKAAALDEELLVADPGNALTRKDVAYTNKKMADFLVELADYSQALLHFGKALESYEKVVADAPTDMISNYLVAVCHAGVARSRAQLGEVEPALDSCRKADAHLRTVAADKAHDMGRAQAYEYLGYAYLALAECQKKSPSQRRRHLNDARDAFREALNLLDSLRGGGTLGVNESWAKELADQVAKCETALDKAK
jgi:eukaryotic-like serine/threonine-protein kinase